MPAAPWIAESLLVILRWIHALAAITFLGWVFSHLLVGGSSRERFKEIADVTLLLFLATGAILSFDRLSNGAGALYAALLVAKIALGVAAYYYAFRWRRAGLSRASIEGWVVLACGAGAVLLAAALKGIFEYGFRSAGA